MIVLIAWPLLHASPGAGEEPGEARRALDDDLDRALLAIREIEMDHRAGNLSDEDFRELDRAERARAAELLRRRDVLRRE